MMSSTVYLNNSLLVGIIVEAVKKSRKNSINILTIQIKVLLIFNTLIKLVYI